MSKEQVTFSPKPKLNVIFSPKKDPAFHPYGIGRNMATDYSNSNNPYAA